MYSVSGQDFTPSIIGMNQKQPSRHNLHRMILPTFSARPDEEIVYANLLKTRRRRGAQFSSKSTTISIQTLTLIRVSFREKKKIRFVKVSDFNLHRNVIPKSWALPT